MFSAKHFTISVWIFEHSTVRTALWLCVRFPMPNRQSLFYFFFYFSVGLLGRTKKFRIILILPIAQLLKWGFQWFSICLHKYVCIVPGSHDPWWWIAVLIAKTFWAELWIRYKFCLFLDDVCFSVSNSEKHKMKAMLLVLWHRVINAVKFKSAFWWKQNLNVRILLNIYELRVFRSVRILFAYYLRVSSTKLGHNDSQSNILLLQNFWSNINHSSRWT